MSTTIEDLDKGLEEITRDKKRRARALNQYNADLDAGIPHAKATRNALKRAAAGLANEDSKYQRGAEAAGVTVSQRATAKVKSATDKLSPQPQRNRVHVEAESVEETRLLSESEHWSQRYWVKPMLALAGLVIAAFIVFATGGSLVFEKYGENVLLGFGMALLYGLLVLVAGLTGGLWLADVLSARHVKRVTSEETTYQGTEALVPSEPSRP